MPQTEAPPTQRAFAAFPSPPETDARDMQGITSSASQSAPVRVSASQAMEVSVMKMQQDQERADGAATQELLRSAAEVQMTGAGGQVDFVA